VAETLPAVASGDAETDIEYAECTGVSINDSISVDLGIRTSGAIGNNELHGGNPKYFRKPR